MSNIIYVEGVRVRDEPITRNDIFCIFGEFLGDRGSVLSVKLIPPNFRRQFWEAQLEFDTRWAAEFVLRNKHMLREETTQLIGDSLFDIW